MALSDTGLVVRYYLDDIETSLIVDAFDRANETPLASPWVRDPDSISGNINLVSNKAVASASGDKLYYHSGLTPAADQWARCRIGIGGTDGGPACRIGGDTGLSGYVISCYGSEITVGKFNNGSFGAIGTASGSISAGDLVEMRVRTNVFGNVEIDTFINGVYDTTRVDSTGNKITAAGDGVGMFLYDDQGGGDGLYDWEGGNLPTQVNDSGPNAYHLTTVDYNGGSMFWVEDSGNRGLHSNTLDSAQRAIIAMANSSDALRTALDGGQKFTVELVCALAGGSNNNGRLFVINGRGGDNATFGITLSSSGGGATRFYWEGDEAGIFNSTPSDSTRRVLHFVVDTTLATTADRIKVYQDGVLNESGGQVALSQNDTLGIPSDVDFIMFNRQNGGTWNRSPSNAKLYYAAIYTGAFDATRVSDHYDVLTLDDDTPSAPLAEKQTLYFRRTRMISRR